jgi:predicted alpha/beta superfamily hydrolase
MRLKALIVTLLLSITLLTEAQQADSTGPFKIPKIETRKIHSSIIGEDYTLYVLKTDGYDTSTNRLPVLYMTDGDWNMTVAMNCFSMLRQDYTTHEPLVVGIGYGANENKRFRDLDPATGGPNFLAFIEKEVMPFVDRQYRTNDERAIYGYSMGGMFTTYILFNRADLFQKIYIGAPGNNGRLLMPAAREYFKTNKTLKSKVFIGVGDFEKETAKNIDSFTTFLKSKKLADLDLSSAITPKAGHGAALAQVMQNAVAFGYCERHKAIAATPSSYKLFTGTYSFMENGKVVAELKAYMKGEKLLVSWTNAPTMSDELIPFAKNEFFVPANERMSYRFEPKELVIAVGGDKDYHLVKK